MSGRSWLAPALLAAMLVCVALTDWIPARFRVGWFVAAVSLGFLAGAAWVIQCPR